MPDQDFTAALEFFHRKKAERDADFKILHEWMREPDHVEPATLEWLLDWVNRRPLAELHRLNAPITPSPRS
jgi:hypothetical protein